MTESGKGAIEYINFINQAAIDIQRIFKVELTKSEQQELKFKLNNAIDSVISKREVD